MRKSWHTALRRYGREMRKAVPPFLARDLDEAITGHILAWDAYREAKTVMLYASVGAEVGTTRLIEAALREGKRVLLPRTLGQGLMLAVQINSLQECRPGWRSIPTPPMSAPIVQAGEIDLILAPGVLFDRRGNRIGQGGGYYDRFLAEYRGMACGLAYSVQVVWWPLFPAAHDRRVQALATEQGIQIFRR